ETAVGDPRHDAALAARLAALSAAVRVPIVVGAAETEKFAATTTDGLSTGERDAWNSAYLVADGAVVGEPYRKRVLMPFGEYLPLRETLTWPAALVPDVVDVRAGDRDAGFEIASSTAPVRIATTICWESEFASLTRNAVVGGARVLVQLTNDAWFGATRAAAQHNLASVMRAVENGVPVVLASNTGPSQVIDRHGRVVARVEGFGRHGVAVAAVEIGAAGGTWYSRVGDVFSFACIAGAALGLGAARSRRAPACPSFSTTFAKESI
ncbi:MAG: apolipoprotein N-acyltransferase, partial [Caldimonas sp.]